MRRTKLTPLIFIVVVACLALGVVFATGTSPQLGLDLQGGVSVVLQPTTKASDEALDQTIEIIRSRVDALGVAEPDIARQGNSVVVQLPGVKNQQRALGLVGATAELRFRPVLASLSKEQFEKASASTTTTAAGGTTSTTAATSSTTATTIAGQSAAATPYQDGGSTTSTTAATSSTTTTPAVGDTTTTTVDPDATPGITPREQDEADQPVVLEGPGGPDDEPYVYSLGPSEATGKIVKTASAELDQQGTWSVKLEIKGGVDNIDLFNQVAGQCYSKAETCPTGQLAIVLDSVVKSAPNIQQPSYEADQIQITGNFSSKDAKDLALVLRYGSLPVNLKPQTVQTVSPTLGKESLKAGLIAGLIGLLLVVAYMILYYRCLGVVVFLGLMVWSALNFSIICWLGSTQGLAMSLAGVTGLVVSVGVTVDSYVVFFERLKDDVRLGRSIQVATERSWPRAFRTIIAANVSSLIGAVLLYILTVGPVRGFAFFLALATSLDVVVAWFFIRPAVAWMGRTKYFTGDGWWSLGSGLGVSGRKAHRSATPPAGSTPTPAGAT